MSTNRESQVALAAALAGVLADAEYWREYAAAAGADKAFPALAQRAADLWRSFVTFLEESPDVDPEAPVGQAVMAFREIASCGLFASYAPAQMREHIPPRSSFEWFIRVAGVDSWALEFGYDLPIAEHAESTDAPWLSGGPEEPEPEVSDFLEWWAVISEHYGWFLDHLDDADARQRWESASWEDEVERWRAAMAQMLGATRAWISWCRRSGEIELLTLGGAMLLMTEGVFVAGWQWPEDGVMTPPPAMIENVLRKSGSLEWVAEQGVDLPEWLP